MTRLAARLGPLVAAPTDAELLARFVAARDAVAFGELVRRHGPAVLAVCRRVTRHAHDAEDAFQAVFVVLARRAADVRGGEPLGAWLYGVAVRVSRRAAERPWRRREATGGVPDVPARPAEPFDPDAARVVIEEVDRLSAAYRAAVVLCELEGRSRAAAARELGIAEGTLSSRLAAARKQLARRLAARGFAPAAPAVLAGVAVPPGLASATSALATGTAAPPAVAALARGVGRAMTLKKLVPVPLAVVASAALVAGLIAGSPGALPVPRRVAAAVAQPPTPRAKSPNRILFYLDGRLALIDPDGTNLANVTEAGKNPTPGSNPRLSPDGKRVAYLWHEAPRPDAPPDRHVYVRGADGTGPATDLGRGDSFAWAPDGARLAVTEFRVAGKDVTAAHRVVAVADKAVTPLPLPADHALTDWSPDGKYLLTQAFTPPAAGKNPEMRLSLRLPTGKEHKALNGAADPLLNGRVSPDGRRVLAEQFVFPARPGAPDYEHRLAVLDVATGAVTPLADYPPAATPGGHSWSPDGTRIVYAVKRRVPDAADPLPAATRLVVCDADGRNPRTILTSRGRSEGAVALAGPDWR